MDTAPSAGDLWVAELYRPGLTEGEACASVEALRTACATLGPAIAIDLLDGTWLPSDESLTTRFRGSRAAVVAAHQLARVGLDRLTNAVAVSGKAPDTLH
jgi:hypothetical protein